MVLIFFGCNLLMAAAIAAPMHTAIADHVGNSMVGEKLARGFDWSWLVEFQIAYAAFLKSFSTAIVWGSVLFLALNTVLSAGAFEVFRASLSRDAAVPHHGAAGLNNDAEVPARYPGLHAFGHGIGKYFLRFARIAIIASVLYFVAFGFWQHLMGMGVAKLFEDASVERWHFYTEWLRWALLALTVFVVNMIVEYAKADMVIDEHKSAFGALGHAAGFVFAHFGRVLAIYLALGSLTLLTIFIYSAFARFFPQSSVLTVAIWFLVAQALLWMRWLFRLSSWGAAVSYYSGQRAAVAMPQSAPAEQVEAQA
ncbi:MAG TPA: hypothetical protein VD837_04565 [Terriglobales bacterium]|nr:hypothetical protein [Terriglobales bacterium]